jgi:hypothetical protein
LFSPAADEQAIRDGALSAAPNLQQLSLAHNSLLRLENNNLFDGLSKLQMLHLSFNKMLTYLHPEMFAAVRDLRFLSVQSCSLSVIDARIANVLPRLQLLDVRNNSLTCNCSVQWIRSHFLNQRNHSASDLTDLTPIEDETAAVAAVPQPNYQTGAGSEDRPYSVPVSNSFPAQLDWLTSDTGEYRTDPSPQSPDHRPHPAPSPAPVVHPDDDIIFDAAQLLPLFEEARCTDPVTGRDSRLIDLGPDVTGCFKSDSMTLIVIAALVVGITVGVIIILIVKFRRRIAHCLSFGSKEDKKRKRPYDLSRAFLPSPITVSSKFNPTPVSTLHVNNNRKVFHGYDSSGGTLKSSQRSLARMPFDEFGSLSSKPEFIFVHNTINLNRGNNRSIGIADSGSSASDLMDPIYRPRHVINNVRNNPYEVVPIVPPVASRPSSRNWSHHIPRHQHPPDPIPYHLQTQHFTDPDDPFHFYERTYEEAECPLNHHLTPSTEL